MRLRSGLARFVALRKRLEAPGNRAENGHCPFYVSVIRIARQQREDSPQLGELFRNGGPLVHQSAAQTRIGYAQHLELVEKVFHQLRGHAQGMHLNRMAVDIARRWALDSVSVPQGAHP